MDQEKVVTENKKRKVLIIIASFILAFTVYYVVMAMLSPGRKISRINQEFGYKAPENQEPDYRIFSDSEFVRLNREKAFKEARITMAGSDSVSLALSLADSTAILELTGVKINMVKISFISLSRVFYKADEYALSALLSRPFTIVGDYASIKKEPLMLKVAPKDTSEYKPDILPDTSNVEAVNYMLQMDNGFRLYVYQELEEQRSGRLGRFFFDLGDRFRNSMEIFRSIIVFKIPEFHPSIKIHLPKADARNIYRGLPRNGQVAVSR